MGKFANKLKRQRAEMYAAFFCAIKALQGQLEVGQ